MADLSIPLRVVGVERTPTAPLLMVSTNRPATPDETAGVLGTLKRHVNGDGAAFPIISQEAARREGAEAMRETCKKVAARIIASLDGQDGEDGAMLVFEAILNLPGDAP